MKTFAAVLLLSVLAIAYCEDCSSAIENFRKCRQEYRKQQEAKRPDPSERQKEVKSCFTKNKCKEPSFEEKEKEKEGGDDREAVRKCHKDISQKARDMVKSCVEKKTGVKLPSKQDGGDDKEKGHKGGRGGRGGDHEDWKKLCSNDQQWNDTRKCLKEMRKDNKEDRREEAEKRFNENCANKRSCFDKLSKDCKKKLNDTKQAACDCAKSELEAKKDDFQKQAEACRANNPNKGGSHKDAGGASSKDGGGRKDGGRHNKDGGDSKRESFVERAVERACDTDDRCDKPFEAKEHKGWSGKGNGKGKGDH